MRNQRKQALLAVMVAIFVLMPPLVVRALDVSKSTERAQQSDAEFAVRHVVPAPDYPSASEERMEMRRAARELEILMAKQKADKERKEAAEAKKLAAKKAEKRKVSLASRSKKAKAAPKAIIPAAGEHGGTWSRKKLAGVLSGACDHYGIKGSKKDWLVAKGVHISADGECRSGQTWLKNKRSTATGLFQFLKSWNKTGRGCKHGASDWRACGTCSCYRFVRAYKEGGDSTLRSAWAATYW